MNRSHVHKRFLTIPLTIISQITSKIRIVQTFSLVLLTIPLWLTTETIATQIARADIARVNVNIQRLPNDTYESMLQRAETVARAATQRTFDQDILVENVSVMVIVQNYGAIVPVLELEVNRFHWRQRPDPRLWITYFKTARSLLSWPEKSTTDNTDPATAPNPANNVGPTVEPPTSDRK